MFPFYIQDGNDIANCLSFIILKDDTVYHLCPVIKDGKSDNFSIIQRYIDMHKGSVIHFPEGSFYVSNTLFIPSNTILIGNNTKFFNRIPDTLLKVNSGVQVDNIELQGIGNQRLESNSIGIFHYSRISYPDSNIIISNCYIHDFGNFGIYLINVNNSKIEETKVENTGYEGIGIYSCNNVNVINCTIDNVIPNSIGNAYGIVYSRSRNPGGKGYPPSSNSTIEGCSIFNIPAWHGIDCHGAIDINILSNRIENCKIGIYLTFFGATDSAQDEVSTSNCYVFNNYIDGRGKGNGIDVFGYSRERPAENNIIDSNIIVNCGIKSNRLGASICVYRTRNNIIKNNIINNAITNGICAAFSNISLRINNNIIKDINGSSITTGINILDTAECLIRGNTITSGNIRDEHSNQYGIRISKISKKFVTMKENIISKVDHSFGISRKL